MKCIKGNKIIDVSASEFNAVRAKFNKVVIDLGTGDGRFVYKNALANPDILYVGVDPAPKQMEEFSKKAVRKKLDNVFFISGSFELLPEELKNCADKLHITLPWGTLLKAVAEPSDKDVKSIKSLLKPNATLEIIFGYDSELEPNQTSRLELDEIDENNVIKKFEQNGFKLLQTLTITNAELKNLESTWGKRISTTSNRKIFKLVFNAC